MKVSLWLFPLCVLVLALGLAIGAVGFDGSAWLALLQGRGSAHMIFVVWEQRLPRLLLAAMVGAQFAWAGLWLQVLSRNPLADAGVLGINAGAALGAVVALALWPGLVPLPAAALAGGLLAGSLLWRLWLGARGGSALGLTLVGAVLAAILSALVMGALVLWQQARLELLLQWLAGSLYGRGWEQVGLLCPWFVLVVLAVWRLAPLLPLLALDEDKAASLGLPLHLARGALLGAAVVAAASAVAVAGPVGFVGVLVPFMARRLGGGVIGCGWLGALLLMGADTLGRVLASPLEWPVGVLTALLGVPLFLYLLHKRV